MARVALILLTLFISATCAGCSATPGPVEPAPAIKDPLPPYWWFYFQYTPPRRMVGGCA